MPPAFATNPRGLATSFRGITAPTVLLTAVLHTAPAEATGLYQQATGVESIRVSAGLHLPPALCTSAGCTVPGGSSRSTRIIPRVEGMSRARSACVYLKIGWRNLTAGTYGQL
ncbi:hypothetical protein [uncultured Thermanaerothrix sp.]|uniref:hypothetical protein n=1 Tax=uncultured Thermanaerothrix sp. TaxID=1195149 RepID=UPI002624A41C|nr:hypothetical protein [uncultured Thermanaerothrix sp.]